MESPQRVLVLSAVLLLLLELIGEVLSQTTRGPTTISPNSDTDDDAETTTRNPFVPENFTVPTEENKFKMVHLIAAAGAGAGVIALLVLLYCCGLFSCCFGGGNGGAAAAAAAKKGETSGKSKKAGGGQKSVKTQKSTKSLKSAKPKSKFGSKKSNKK